MSRSLDDPFEYLSLEIEPGVRYCFDDSYIVDPLVIERDPFVLTRMPRRVFVKEMSPVVRQYNQMSLSDSPILVKTCFEDEKIKSTDWKMPAEYRTMTMAALTTRLLNQQAELGLEDTLIEVRNQRIVTEMRAYKATDQLDLIRLMCYIVDTMTAANQIWGVGRGSSVSSYVLYLIGVHDIDSVEYDLDFTDFMKSHEIP